MRRLASARRDRNQRLGPVDLEQLFGVIAAAAVGCESIFSFSGQIRERERRAKLFASKIVPSELRLSGLPIATTTTNLPVKLVVAAEAAAASLMCVVCREWSDTTAGQPGEISVGTSGGEIGASDAADK